MFSFSLTDNRSSNTLSRNQLIEPKVQDLLILSLTGYNAVKGNSSFPMEIFFFLSFARGLLPLIELKLSLLPLMK